MATRRQHIDVLGMPWSELVERVARVAATGDQPARAMLEEMVEEERRASAEGRDPHIFARLSTLRVLDRRHAQPTGQTSQTTRVGGWRREE